MGIIDTAVGYARNVAESIVNPAWDNFFYYLIIISFIFFLVEYLHPWRRQKLIRKDFWLDVFYMFFNMFIFPLLGFYAVSQVVYRFTADYIDYSSLRIFDFSDMPQWGQLAILFVARDFIHWNVHIALHRFNFLWKFHSIHHSVEQMGFASHLRYHWMENVVYRIFEFSGLALIGFSIQNIAIVYLTALTIGHFAHTNTRIPIGPFKYIINNPQFHYWHHVKDIPQRYGTNFAISLSLWDYLFRKNYEPYSAVDEELGINEKVPETFIRQNLYPVVK